MKMSEEPDFYKNRRKAIFLFSFLLCVGIIFCISSKFLCAGIVLIINCVIYLSLIINNKPVFPIAKPETEKDKKELRKRSIDRTILSILGIFFLIGGISVNLIGGISVKFNVKFTITCITAGCIFMIFSCFCNGNTLWNRLKRTRQFENSTEERLKKLEIKPKTIEEKLQTPTELKEKGLISDDEFEEQKKKLLDEI